MDHVGPDGVIVRLESRFRRKHQKPATGSTWWAPRARGWWIAVLFASAYVVLAAISASNFGGHLSHTEGLYFTVTVFSTVGFGDITPKTETARLVVTGQMIADLIILGIAIKVIVGAVRHGREASTR